MVVGPIYRIAQLTLRALTPLIGAGEGKLARGLRGRREAHDRLSWWGTAARDPDRPTVWFHAPSVGEGLQARSVMEALRERRPEVQVVFTHFSPSAEALAEVMPVDVSDYLPWDVPSAVRPVMDALDPRLVVFTKTEVWPVVVEEAHRRGVPVAMIAGSLPPGASRRRRPARLFLRRTWERLAAVAAVVPEDAAGFSELGVPPGVVEVAGDPGIDSAAQRAAGADPDSGLLGPFTADPRPTLVAGSIWPSDERVLLRGLSEVSAAVPALRIVVAPHEPHEAYVGELVRAFAERGFSVARLSEIEAAGSARGVDVVVVDRVGPLAHLYTVGSVAFVGGGFHEAGLHSVLEPAAAGLPVVFGPRHGNTPAAAELIAAEAAAVVGSADDLAQVLLGWFQDDERLHFSSARGRGYIDAHLGAAGRTADLLDRLIDQHADPGQ